MGNLRPVVIRGRLAGISPLAFIVLVLPLACHRLGLVSRCFRVVWSCLFLSPSCLCLVFSSPCPLCVCHLRLVFGLFFSISSGLVVLCLLSCLCLVLSCLALASVLVLSYRCCVGLYVMLCCVFVGLGRFVDSFLVVWGRLGGRCWPFWVVLGGSWERFGRSLGTLGRSWGMCWLGSISRFQDRSLNHARPRIDF